MQTWLHFVTCISLRRVPPSRPFSAETLILNLFQKLVQQVLRPIETLDSSLSHIYQVKETSVQILKNLICSLITENTFIVMLPAPSLLVHLTNKDGSAECFWWCILRVQQFQARLCPLFPCPVSSGGVFSSARDPLPHSIKVFR